MAVRTAIGDCRTVRTVRADAREPGPRAIHADGRRFVCDRRSTQAIAVRPGDRRGTPAPRMAMPPGIQILAKTGRLPGLREVLCPRRAPGASTQHRGLAQDASLTDLGRRVADQHSLRRISPEPLQIVELACLLVENMNDHILVVKQNPVRLAGAFPVQHAHALRR